MSDTNAPFSFDPKNLKGFRFIEPVRGLLASLHAENDHPNRLLHYDEYVCLLLLVWFNPALKTLRAVQHASGLQRVQDELGVRPVSLGSLSEAAAVFDPEPLRQIFLDLAEQAQADDAQKRPRELPAGLIAMAADSTFWSFLPRMAPYFWKDGPKTGRPPGYKAHVQFDLFRGTPADVAWSPGYTDDRSVIARKIRAGIFYIFDAGYIDYALFQQIIDAKSSFLVRARSVTAYEVIREFEISPEARAAGVYFDGEIALGSAPHAHKVRQSLRLIKAQVPIDPPHNLNPKRGGVRHEPRDPHAPQTLDLVLITDRFDLPADVLVQMYRFRWQVEIFFRWFKCVMGCSHLLSECDNGIQLQLYAAMIASLLITLYTGRKPNKRLLETVQLYFMGWATYDELMAVVQRLKPATA